MYWENKKVLVTGSEGFIGSHLVERLVAEGARIRAFVYYNAFNNWGWLEMFPKKTLQKIEVFCGDIRDPYGVSQAVGGMEFVFHLAALIGIPFSYYSPDSYVDTNIKGTLNILQAARQHGVKKVIHTSTSEVYGTAQHIPMNEQHPINPQSPYAATKSAADELALSFYRSFDLPVTILRPFNTFGPRQSNRAVIPTIISQIWAGSRKIKLGNIETRRDFNYVANTVDAFLAVAKTDQCVGEVFNAGSGREFSIRDIVLQISKMVGETIQIQKEDHRLRPQKSEVERLCCDSSKIQKLCHWKPSVSFEAGLKRTYQWIGRNWRYYQKTQIYNI